MADKQSYDLLQTVENNHSTAGNFLLNAFLILVYIFFNINLIIYYLVNLKDSEELLKQSNYICKPKPLGFAKKNHVNFFFLLFFLFVKFKI